MTFLERLGVSRRHTPPQASEKKVPAASHRKKAEFSDAPADLSAEMLDRDSLEIPAFMRNKRKNYCEPEGRS